MNRYTGASWESAPRLRSGRAPQRHKTFSSVVDVEGVAVCGSLSGIGVVMSVWGCGRGHDLPEVYRRVSKVSCPGRERASFDDPSDPWDSGCLVCEGHIVVRRITHRRLTWLLAREDIPVLLAPYRMQGESYK